MKWKFQNGKTELLKLRIQQIQGLAFNRLDPTEERTKYTEKGYQKMYKKALREGGEGKKKT